MNCSGKYKSLQAFTLLELLVGMILSGIVLGATFSAYRIVSKEAVQFRDQSKSANELSFFLNHLHSDFYRSVKINSDEEERIHLIQKKRELIYRFSAEYVLRSEQEHTDTFFVSVPKAELFSHGEQLNAGEDADELKLQFKSGDKTEKLNFCRRKSSRELLANEIELIRKSDGH